MKFLFKKVYIILFLSVLFLIQSKAFAIDNKILYASDDISNYFLGIISANKDHNKEAFKYLKKVESIKNSHTQFNVEFIRTLVLLEKFDKAIIFSENIWKENELFFEADLLLGINFFIKKDFKKAEKFFKRLNKISRHNLYFDEFIGNIMLAWSQASQGNKKKSFDFLEKIPKPYSHLKKTQEGFLKCFFNDEDTQNFFKDMINDESYNFSRYNFFLANYFLYENKDLEAKKIIENGRKKYSSNLLIKETEYFLKNKKYEKIKNFYNCKNPKDSLAELFYVIGNLYSGENDYQLSSFYLKISHFLNKDFITNHTLLAENFYKQKKYEDSKNIYKSIKKLGPTYSWHSSKMIATILLKEKGKESSVKKLQKEFDSLPNKNFKHYYELANFYKDQEYYEKSVKYYSLAIKKIQEHHSLFATILDRRGTSYERLGDWKNAEKDLTQSLEILPKQAHVLNYLAYTWIDKGINLDKGLEMLKKANQIVKDDGYIIDSLGWAYYAKENYEEAEKFLQKAVELIPFDPIINDHYGDALWMLNKDIQARHAWSSVLKLDKTEKELKNKVNKKLIFGITKNYN